MRMLLEGVAKVGTFRMRTGGGYVSVSNDMAAFR